MRIVPGIIQDDGSTGRLRDALCLEALPSAITVFDLKGRVLFQNRNSRVYLGDRLGRRGGSRRPRPAGAPGTRRAAAAPPAVELRSERDAARKEGGGGPEKAEDEEGERAADEEGGEEDVLSMVFALEPHKAGLMVQKLMTTAGGRGTLDGGGASGGEAVWKAIVRVPPSLNGTNGARARYDANGHGDRNGLKHDSGVNGLQQDRTGPEGRAPPGPVEAPKGVSRSPQSAAVEPPSPLTSLLAAEGVADTRAPAFVRLPTVASDSACGEGSVLFADDSMAAQATEGGALTGEDEFLFNNLPVGASVELGDGGVSFTAQDPLATSTFVTLLGEAQSPAIPSTAFNRPKSSSLSFRARARTPAPTVTATASSAAFRSAAATTASPGTPRRGDFIQRTASMRSPQRQGSFHAMRALSTGAAAVAMLPEATSIATTDAEALAVEASAISPAVRIWGGGGGGAATGSSVGGDPDSGRGAGARSGGGAQEVLPFAASAVNARSLLETTWEAPTEEAGAEEVGAEEVEAEAKAGEVGGAVPECWHEVWATKAVDPFNGSDVIILTQTDVTAKVTAERHLALVMEAEHALVEQLFPRHVLEYIAEEWISEAVGAPAAALSLVPRGDSGRSGGRGGGAGGAVGGGGGGGALSGGSKRWQPVLRDCTTLATWHPEVTLLFADIKGFTPMCKEVEPRQVMRFLNDLYSRYDAMLDKYGVYKVETIGDCYFVASGLIREDEDGMAAVREGDQEQQRDYLHAERAFMFAKAGAMLCAAREVRMPTDGQPVEIRIGLHSGPAVSGVVGTRMPRFCLFGDTVNTASRMESTGQPGAIHASEATVRLLRNRDHQWEPTGGIEVKGKGLMDTFVWRPVEGLGELPQAARDGPPPPSQSRQDRSSTMEPESVSLELLPLCPPATEVPTRPSDPVSGEHTDTGILRARAEEAAAPPEDEEA
ncbi:hypothetical protein GPECTOR_15g514 [Gonium pectorale]|uniref:Guanylate cyclase domain-containing protein n=1 Tax=Gonium pectorale TaxID=33097 RepID=A0A150GM24_GONPE|nr:hypothetical protein GPECTOR_15g514 [Gonium pectorale]|eukprot:KXZ50828.1 hypothetical protein GPECTOR_15g514 [Gonium pectorale]